MEAKERKINEVLTENKLYEIPPYQRPYSWDDENTIELIQDIYDAFNRKDNEYFIGSIITIEKEKNKVFEVVDGQQRLTTLNLILAKIKQLISNASSISDLQKRLMPVNPYTDEPEQPRLTVRKQDQNFFLQHILLGTEIGEHQSLSETQEKFKLNMEVIKIFLEEHNEQTLRQLVNYILENVYVVFVTTNNFTSAYRMFNVLNARGMSLANGDLIKNKLFEFAERKEVEKVNIENYWNELENIIGIKELDSFLGHLRTSIKGNKAQETLFKEYYSILNEYKAAPSAFAKLIVESANNYVKITGNDFDSFNIRKYIASLELVPHDEWIPPILAFLNNPVPDIQLEEYVLLIEKITYQNWIRRLGKTKRNTVYYNLINLIKKGTNRDIIIDTFKSFSNNLEFKNLVEGDFYNNGYSLPVLLRLEQEFQDESVIKTYNGRITMEHILPQELKDKYWQDRFTKEEHITLLHKVGNLTLLSGNKNSAAQYYSFDKKKDVYLKRNKRVSFDLTKEVCEEQEWSMNQINNRQERLVNKINQLWEI